MNSDSKSLYKNRVAVIIIDFVLALRLPDYYIKNKTGFAFILFGIVASLSLLIIDYMIRRRQE